MASEELGPGELLHSYGSVVCRLLHRQFPSLSGDTIDAVVIESIARAWKRIEKSPRTVAGREKTEFALILTIARRIAIDHLRYAPRIRFESPGKLDAVISTPRSAEPEQFAGELLGDLQGAVSDLEELDRRVLRAAMSPPLSGDWARELAIQLLWERRRELHQVAVASQPEYHGTTRDVDEPEILKLSGKLRVRKLRAIKKLRQKLQAKGYEVSGQREKHRWPHQ